MALYSAIRVKVSTATTGTSNFVVGSAVSSAFQSFADAGVTDGSEVDYVAYTSTQWEAGTGTYTSGTTTLSRDTIDDSSTGAKVNFSSAPTIAITFLPKRLSELGGDLYVAGYDILSGTQAAPGPGLTLGTTIGGVFAHQVDLGANSYPGFYVTNTAADAGGPELWLYQNSVSPAAYDICSLAFGHNDSAGNPTSYGVVGGYILDPTDGTEDGGFVFASRVAGSYVNQMQVTSGVSISGSDLYPGLGSLAVPGVIVLDSAYHGIKWKPGASGTADAEMFYGASDAWYWVENGQTSCKVNFSSAENRTGYQATTRTHGALDSGNNATLYGFDTVSIADNTNGSEDGAYAFATTVAGTLYQNQLYVSNGVSVGATDYAPGQGVCAVAKGVLYNGITFANAPASTAGTLCYFTDSSVSTVGNTITGGGANKVLGWYNGTNWKVVAV